MNSKDPMPCRQLTSALVVAFLAAGCACPRTAPPDTEYPGEKAQIQRRLHEIMVAAENKDFTLLDSYHLYGSKFSKFTGFSAERLDAAIAQKGEHDGLGAARNLKMRTDGLKIDVFGNVGIATFILDYSFDSAGRTIHGKERSTLVFVKDGGAWRIAHEHLSAIKE